MRMRRVGMLVVAVPIGGALVPGTAHAAPAGCSPTGPAQPEVERYLLHSVPGSHGWVNLLRRDAVDLSALTRRGTPVTISGRKPGT
ncbi:MAG TPA: L,D-transpeptidase [Mycobacteriales bacterium]|jgi:hypothetical protein